MSYSVRLELMDLDGNDAGVTYVLDNHPALEEALEQMDRVASHEYAATGIAPRLLDGTLYWEDHE
jgi:hypothetical protein